MGLNAFFAYTLVIQGGVPWPVALGIVFKSGVLHAALHVLAGKRHDVTRGAWTLAALSIVLLVLEHAR